MDSRDFYCGFEGESGVRLEAEAAGKGLYSLSIWTGYFDVLVSRIPPESDGYWSGVTQAYHLHDGWYSGLRWRVADLGEFKQQWARISALGLSPHEAEVYQAIGKMIDECLSQDWQLYISEF